MAGFKQEGLEYCTQNGCGNNLSLAVAKQQIDSGWASVLVADGEVLDREKGRGIKPALLILQRRIQSVSQCKEASKCIEATQYQEEDWFIEADRCKEMNQREEENPGTTGIARPNLVFGDKVLGLAAFRLGALMGAGVMWGGLVSQPVLAEAAVRGIVVLGGEFVPSILNRAGDDLCPMEKLAALCKSDKRFYSELLKKLRES